jgi:transcriptional regulator with XRE-family HTH domain
MSHIVTDLQDPKLPASHHLWREECAQVGYAVTMALRIKELRLKKKLTQGELASMAGMSRPLLAMFESSARLPNTRRLEALAKALDVPTEALFDSNDEVWGIAAKVQRLSAENRATIVRLAEALAQNDLAADQDDT